MKSLLTRQISGSGLGQVSFTGRELRQKSGSGLGQVSFLITI